MSKSAPTMKHRHLNKEHEDYCLASVDSFIDRGTLDDWAELRQAAEADPTIYARIIRVCRANLDHPYSRERYRLWLWYAEACLRMMRASGGQTMCAGKIACTESADL